MAASVERPEAAQRPPPAPAASPLRQATVLAVGIALSLGALAVLWLFILLVMGLTYVGLRLIGLPFALVFAVIAGLLEAIPIIGSFVAGVIIVSFALTQSIQTALITLAFILVLQQFEGNILTPLVMRSQTDVPAFLILVAIALGGSAGGLLGVLIAIPLAGALKVITVEVIAPALRRRAGRDPGAG